MFALLGDVQFDLITYFDGFESQFGADYAEHPRTIILSSHLIDEVANLIERVVVIDGGRIVRPGEIAPTSAFPARSIARSKAFSRVCRA